MTTPMNAGASSIGGLDGWLSALVVPWREAGWWANHWGMPWAWLLLMVWVAAVVAAVLRHRRGVGVAVGVPWWRVAMLPRTLRQRTAWVPAACWFAGLLAMIVAAARPQHTSGREERIVEAVAIQIVLDRSSSMSEPMIYEGREVPKFEAARSAILRFLGATDPAASADAQRAGRARREGDLIGMVGFARFSDTLAPLAQEHAPLIDAVRKAQPVRLRAEDGTAIGDAVKLAAARLRRAEEDLERRALASGATGPRDTIRSKVIVLVTDGQNTAGEATPEEATQLAAQWGITIYTIAIGASDARGGLFGPVRGGVDEATLQAMATGTGGRFFAAAEGEAVDAAYEAIGELERSRVVAREFTSVTELYALPGVLGLVLVVVAGLAGPIFWRATP